MTLRILASIAARMDYFLDNSPGRSGDPRAWASCSCGGRFGAEVEELM
jgi:hypothetical protein